MTIHFQDAIEKAADILLKQSDPSLLIRDLHGRISIAIDQNKNEFDHQRYEQIKNSLLTLGVYCGSNPVLFRDDFYNSEIIFSDPSICNLSLTGKEGTVRLLDRVVTGQDWTMQPQTPSASPRLVFFGIKGGLGRSTALSLLSYQLAKQGQRVLLLDLDLESPGLSSLLLRDDRLPEFGVVDWLIEDGLGQGDSLISHMVVNSPLSDDLSGTVRVVSAFGIEQKYYIDKLSRIYGDTPGNNNGTETFSQRIERLITKLEEIETPDVVLIDSRAGMHDLAALSIVRLSTMTYLFATETSQNWRDYRLLFSYWKSRPQIAIVVRKKLQIVYGMFPEANQAENLTRFEENAYDLFTTLYDEDIRTDEAVEDPESPEKFTFDPMDESAPHFPVKIDWNSRFIEFDPLSIPDGLFNEDQLRASYGEFFNHVSEYLQMEKSDE